MSRRILPQSCLYHIAQDRLIHFLGIDPRAPYSFGDNFAAKLGSRALEEPRSAVHHQVEEKIELESTSVQFEGDESDRIFRVQPLSTQSLLSVPLIQLDVVELRRVVAYDFPRYRLRHTLEILLDHFE